MLILVSMALQHYCHVHIWVNYWHYSLGEWELFEMLCIIVDSKSQVMVM